jgi:hypothetical protein
MQILGLRDYDPMAFYAGIPPLRQAIDQVLFCDLLHSPATRIQSDVCWS